MSWESERKPRSVLLAFSSPFRCGMSSSSLFSKIKILGPVENSQELLAILAYLRSRQLQSIVMTQDLSTDFPDIDYSGKFELIAGFLTVPLSSEGKDFIVFFRKGQLQVRISLFELPALK